MRNFSLKIKMTLVVFLLVSTVISVVAGLGLLFFIREFKANVASHQFATVSSTAADLDDDIRKAQHELIAVARSVPPTLINDPAGMQRFLDGRLDLQDVFADGVGFMSRKGILTAFSPGQTNLIGRNFSFRDFYKETVATGRPYISQPFLPMRSTGDEIVVFTAPVLDAKGRMAGMLAGRLDLTEENVLGRLSHFKVGENGDYFLFNKKRQLIVQRDHGAGRKSILSTADYPLVARAIAGFEGSAESDRPEPKRHLCAFKRLDSTGWILGARVPTREAYAPIQRAQKMVAYCLAAALPLSLLAVWLFVRNLTRPLLRLTRRIERMAGTDARNPATPVCGDEIAVLEKSFEEVMQELGRQTGLLEKEKAFSEQLLQQTAVPSLVIDTEHRVIIWNRACEELTGMTAGEVVGGCEAWRAFYETSRKVLADIIIDGTLHEMADLYSCYSDSPLIPEGLRAEGWYQLRGKQKFLIFDAAPIRDAEGRVIAAIQTLQDVTLRAQTEEQLRKMVAAIGESEERFRRLVELSLDGIAILVGRHFAFINAAGCEMLGHSDPEELNGKAIHDFIHQDSRLLFDEQLDYARQSGATAPWLEERLIRTDGTGVEVELGMTRFLFRGEEALQVIFRDITERKLAKAKLESLAHYDSLTSLPNRVLFFDRLKRAVAESDRYRHPMALMFLDLDRFKEINDTLGHAAGDAVLIEAGHRLKECVRACDMVARMGGDEFTIILSKLADELDAALVAERIITSLAYPFQVEGTLASIGVSIGICVYPTFGSDLDAIVRYADLALYKAKGAGRNGYRFYSEEEQKGGISS
jgi:diguanylate cyclase (GGDEF)-like protein/PAS domain S-box-containing protein